MKAKITKRFGFSGCEVVSATPVADCENWGCIKLGGHHFKCAGYGNVTLIARGNAVLVSTSAKNDE